MKVYGRMEDTLSGLVHPDEMAKQKKEIKFAYDQLLKDLKTAGDSVSVGELSELINKIISDMGLTGRKKDVLENFFDIFVGASKTLGLKGGHDFASLVIEGKPLDILKQMTGERTRQRGHAEIDLMEHPDQLTEAIHDKLGFFPELVASVLSIVMTTTDKIHGLEIETNGRTNAKVKILFDDAPNITLYGMNDGEEKFIIQKKKNKEVIIFEEGLLS
jgi:hypothetical protein